MFNFVNLTGRSFFELCVKAALFFIFSVRTIFCFIKFRDYWENTLYAFMEVFFFSLLVVALTSLSTGSVLTVHTYTGLQLFKDEEIVAEIVSLAIMRELAPAITGIILSAKVVSWATSELASMRITNQIDALEVMGIDTYSTLVFPRILACCIGFPLMLILADIFALYGGYLVIQYYFKLSGLGYISHIINILQWYDIYIGLVKSLIFSLIAGLVSCYMGYNATGGTRGVGINTTFAIVMVLVMIMVLNYFITSIMSV
ncbi:ABC transporter permease [Anaplasmataceae bacterium AB001_6]|nr:ABC transporter permease [Anaplasmataceae bacterium AB001_6]